MSAITIIVIDVPGLAGLLERNGYKSVDGEGAITTANELKEAGQKYIVIANAVSPVSRAWLSRQASQRIPVLLTGGDTIDGTKSVELPATVNEIMAFFGAPPKPAGEVLVGVPEVVEEDEDDPFSVFGSTDQSPEADMESDVSHDMFTPAPKPAPVVEATPSVFNTPNAEPVTSVFSEPETATEVYTDTPKPSDSDEIEPERAVRSVFETPAEPVASVFEAPAPAPEPAPSVFSTPAPEPVVDAPVSVFEAPAPAPVIESRRTPSSFSVPDDEQRQIFPPQVAEPEQEMVRIRPTPTRGNVKKSNVIVVFGAKGGIGKSNTVIGLAERAATVVARPADNPFKVIAIDANRGQGDIRTYLHLRSVPSIYDAAKSGRATASILTPTKLNGVRIGKTELHFGLVLAPTGDQADPSVVTSSVYAEVIEEARSLADLVIIDTQIKEHHDTTGLFDDVIIPLLRGGAWGLGLTNSVTASYENLKGALNKLQADQVPKNRLMFAINNADPLGGIDPDQVKDLLSHLASWVGVAVSEPTVAAAANLGEVPGATGDAPEFVALLDNVIGRVLGGNEVLRPSVSRKAQEVGQKERRRRWGRK